MLLCEWPLKDKVTSPHQFPTLTSKLIDLCRHFSDMLLTGLPFLLSGWWMVLHLSIFKCGCQISVFPFLAVPHPAFRDLLSQCSLAKREDAEAGRNGNSNGEN